VIKETVCIKEKKLGLTVTNGKIGAVLRSNTQKTGLRLYDDNCLGIAGAIGAYNEDELINNAKHMLKFKLPYEAAPTSDVKRSLDLSGKMDISDEEFVELSKKVLDALNTRYPQFMFSNKINLMETEESLINDAGVELVQCDRYFELVLLIKYRESKSMMDSIGFVQSRVIDYDQILKNLSWSCDAYEQKADFSETFEKIPVVMIEHQAFLMKFLTDLRGDVFANGASLFSGKTGEKLFDDKFSLEINRNTEKTLTRFFDGEGIVLPDDRFALIENGVLKAPYSSKRMAKQYNLPVTGSATMQYDSVPDATPYGAAVASSEKTLKELLGGRKAIYALYASGGDFTPQGEYASPIQAAYMFDGENFLGRLPQLSMSSHVNDMFGKDFVGASSDVDYPGSPCNYLVVDMNVRKIDGWM